MSNNATTGAAIFARVSPFAVPIPADAVMPAIKIRPPEFYIGERDGFKCEAWLLTLRRFLIGAHVPVAERTLHSVMLLSGPAALWWDGCRLPDDTHIDVFVDKFREAFRPKNFVESVRAELLDIRMTGTLGEYITRFRRLVSVLMPEGQQGPDQAIEDLGRTVFMKGLTPVLHRMIYANVNMLTANIEEVINAAEYYVHFVQGDASGSAALPAPPRPNPNPMGMDLDNLQVFVNAIMQAHQQNGYQQNGYHQQQQQYHTNTNQQHSRHRPNNNHNNNWAHLKPLTPKERKYLIDNGGCFKCRQLGHLSYEGRCPPPPRNMNHIVTNEGFPFPGPSGNAPSGQA
ncbi:hypothetical protein BGZ75_001849 [Mortierella antarctica]|nr:hypothetical protein BGZ75_001849 [Mortierella antarctica]